MWCAAAILFFCMPAQAQDTMMEHKGYMLSSVLIADMEKGFDVDKFINRLQQDSTFYKAFKSMGLVGYTQYNDISFYDDEGEVKDFYSSVSNQKRTGNCRKMTFANERFSKNYYDKKKDYEYTTASFYHKLFLPTEKVCGEDNIVNGELSESESSRINQLKELIFRPGESIKGVPGVGGKVGIFEEDRKKQYDFALTKELYNGQWCYVFKAKPKPEFKNNNVINYLNTWFRVSDYAVVQRNYSLSYKTLVYDFDVEMKVKLKTAAGYLLPYEVFYKGNWHFVGKRRERCQFSAILSDFE